MRSEGNEVTYCEVYRYVDSAVLKKFYEHPVQSPYITA